MDRWSLPGPAHFLRRVADALREGQNLVLATPVHALAGLSDVLERHLHSESWRVAGPVADDASDPVDQLFSALALDDGGASRRSVALLCQRLEAGQVILIRGVGRSGWPAWKRMLEEYEVASRGVSAFDRPLLVVLTEGVSLSALPCRAAALKVIPWQDVVGELDVLLYATDTFRDRGTLDFRSRLLARVVGRLALWDFTLADYLLDQKPADLFRPGQILQLASDTMDHPSGMELSWESGGLQRFDGVEMVHPFLVMAGGDRSSELAMRVWAAQAAEILPALELHRRALARRMRTMVSLPIQLGDEQFGDVDDLEIGQLAHLANTRRLSHAIRQTADKWRRLRNKLAHLEALEANDALDAELLSIGCGSNAQ